MPILLRNQQNADTPVAVPKTLMPHQVRMVSYLRDRAAVRKGGSLFVEMRLGKTLSIIRYLSGASGRKLVIAPLSVCKTWERELKEDGQRSVINIGGLLKKRKTELLEQKRHTWTIVNYESAQRLNIHEYFSSNDAIVLDESIAIANPSSGISKYLMKEKLFPQWRKYALCGLPAPEGSMQYFNQVAFTQGSLLAASSFWGFRARNYEQVGYGWEPMVDTDRRICEELDRKCFVLTRDEAGVGSAKEYRRFYAQMTKEQKKAYGEMLADFEVEGASTTYVTTQLLYLARIAGGSHPTRHTQEDGVWYSSAKLELVRDLLSGELKGSQVIVWFRFRSEVGEALRYLTQEFPNLRFGVITGETEKSHREHLRESFVDRKDTDVMLMTISTSKRGLDFSSADAEIYYSNEYSADARGQSEDRIIHPKKKRQVLVIDLLTEGTVDEHVLDILKDKKISQRMFMTKLLLRLQLDRKFKD